MRKAEYIDAAERIIRETEGLIQRQRELVQRMTAAGRATFHSRRLLESLEDALHRYRAHRDLVMRLKDEG